LNLHEAAGWTAKDTLSNLIYPAPELLWQVANSPLERLFERHFSDWKAALHKFRHHLELTGLDFRLEENIFEREFPDQPGFPKNLPSSIYYFISGSGFGSVKRPSSTADSSTHLCTSDGVSLNMGCPVRLARALDMLFSLDEEDRREPLLNIKTRENHFATVEEVLWLTLWKQQSGITRGGELQKREDTQKAKDIDWFFWSDAQPIYLEVKFRKTDWMRLADGQQGQLRRAFFDDIGSKFPKEESVFQKCIVGITGFAEPDDSFYSLCEKKLISTPALSGVLFRTLLGPVTICSLNPATVMALAERLRFPHWREYPLHYQVAFNRILQQKRLTNKPRKRFPEKGRLFYAKVPGPAPTFNPQFPMRFKIPQWSSTGLPTLEHVPPFLPNAVDPAAGPHELAE
jgi:hypothetical protein